MQKIGNLYVACISVLIFSFVLIGGVVPAQADDATVGSDGNWHYFDQGTEDFFHQDADPYKGFFMLWTQNNTGTAWTGFNFSLSESNAVFVDSGTWCSTTPDGNCEPHSSFGVDSWSISSPDQQSMSVSLNTTWGDGQTGWIRVYTDNTAAPQGDFKISVTPVLVPEPISSTLFIVGGATLGFRRFRKKFKK